MIVWNGARGAFAGASLGAKQISWAEERNARFYNEKATPTEILGGKVEPAGDASKLNEALSG